MEDVNLEPLVTRCPHCQTRFRVTEHQLQLAAGRVRCGACLTVFQGAEHLIWDEPLEFDSEEEAQSALDALLDELDGPHGDSAAKEVTAEADSDSADAPSPAWMTSDNRLYGGHEGPSGITLEENHWPGARAAVNEPAPHVEPDPPAEPAPVEDAPAPAAATQHPAAAAVTQESPASALPAESEFANAEPTVRRWWVPVAMIVAIATLCVQIIWYQFDRWSVDPEMRPLYAVVCGVLGCELPVMLDLDSMVAKNLVVRSHPEVAGALLVNAVIVNAADYAQPFPVLELRFTGLHGDLVAGRQFKPDEYLAGELLGARMVPRNVPIHIELAIEDPGEAAVNYFLSFR
jgi:predicted Zn finger-like uncharacterized protein